MNAYKRILVPTDGTTLSLKAAREAATLAKDLEATITAAGGTEALQRATCRAETGANA